MKKTVGLILWLVLTSFNVNSQQPSRQYRPVEKLEALIYYLDNYYVDTLNENQIVETGINGILKELDPHSYYLTAKEKKEMDEPLVGNFEGIGIQFNIFHDTIMVVSPISGGPSEKLGIRSGDKIIYIEDTLVAGTGITNNDVFKKLRGTKGSKVTIKIMRRGEKKLMEFTITRDKIPVFSVDAVYMAAPEVGYIKVNRFGQTTMQEFHEGLRELKNSGAKHLILDLSDNSGGYLHAAVEMADAFLKSGELIVYTEGNHSPRRNYYATGVGEFESGKIVVLINEGSASASEIVSGAIQDHDRGIIIGRRSFGKGLVQNTFDFPDGSAVRITTARYYTPSGRCVQAPYGDGIEKYYKDLYSRFKHGELTNPDSIHFPDSLKFLTTKYKRTVYGGGGVMPDVFIPLDTTFYTEYLTELTRKNVVYEFCLEYTDRHRSELKSKYPDFDSFDKGMMIDGKLWDEFLKYADKKEVKMQENELKTSQDFIKMRIKAGFAQNLWGREEFFRVWNNSDEAFLKALELIKSGKMKGIQEFEN